MKTYSFNAQLTHGQRGEELLDKLFETLGYTIKQATDDEQRKGIDRHLALPNQEMSITVEYKTDYYDSGNAFVETDSVLGSKRGWAYTSQADYLVYAVIRRKRAWMIPMSNIREKLSDWIKRCRSIDVPNEGYFTRGLLVKLEEFDAIASQVLSLP